VQLQPSRICGRMTQLLLVNCLLGEERCATHVFPPVRGGVSIKLIS